MSFSFSNTKEETSKTALEQWKKNKLEVEKAFFNYTSNKKLSPEQQEHLDYIQNFKSELKDVKGFLIQCSYHKLFRPYLP
jgi:hypothetical protein